MVCDICVELAVDSWIEIRFDIPSLISPPSHYLFSSSSLPPTSTPPDHLPSSTDIGVFFCGPPVLSHNLHHYCNEYTTQNDATRARFFYNKENF